MSPVLLDGKEKDLDIDSFKIIQKEHPNIEFVILTQRRGIGSGFRIEEIDGFKCYLFDFSKKIWWLSPFDRLLKSIIGIRKFLTDTVVLKRFLEIEKPDILHSDNVWPWGVIAFFAKKLSKHKPNVLCTRQNTEHLNTPFDYPNRPDSALIKALNRLVYKNHYLRANSPLTKKWLIENGADEERIYMLPIAVSKNFNLSLNNLYQNRVRLLSLSRLTPMKGIDILIEAMREVAKKLPEVTLDIYGIDEKTKDGGSYKEYLKKVASECGVLDRVVFFKDRIEKGEVTNVMKNYYFNVVSSHGETLNLVSAECASVGLPSIVTEYVGIKDWIERFECGFVCECDKNSLSEAIIKACLLNEEEYKKIQQNLPAMYEEFTPQRIADGLKAIYLSISSCNT